MVSLPGAPSTAPMVEPSARRQFSLAGCSIRLDPRHHAVRRDLADVRLADRVFAPHYAAPALHVLARPAMLMADRRGDGDPIATLSAGDVFEVIEFAGGHAWGVAPGRALVGYLDAGAFAPEPEAEPE